MEKEIKIKLEMFYNGHDIKSNGNINLKFKCAYSELADSIQTLQMLNNDIKIYVKLPDERKPKQLGIFRLKENKISSDGESSIIFNSQIDYVELGSINEIANSDCLRYLLKALVEIDDNEDG